MTPDSPSTSPARRLRRRVAAGVCTAAVGLFGVLVASGHGHPPTTTATSHSASSTQSAPASPVTTGAS